MSCIKRCKRRLIQDKNEKYNTILLNLAMPEFSGYNILIVFKKEDLLN
jgi:hypothetical protein